VVFFWGGDENLAESFPLVGNRKPDSGQAEVTVSDDCFARIMEKSGLLKISLWVGKNDVFFHHI